METLEFKGDKTNINDIVEFINKGLSDGFTVQELRKILGISEKVQQKLFREHEYKYNQKFRSYIKNNNKEVQVNIIKESMKSSNTKVVQNNHTVDTQGNEMIEILNTMKEMKVMQTQFQEMYQWYKIQTDINIIDVDIPEFKVIKNNNETISRNLRIYTDTNNLFNEFCKEHKECKIQDILNTALVEFINRYK
ncbi:MAG: hypothetical protein ACRCX2_22390 [Paraclostridium sp.]